MTATRPLVIEWQLPDGWHTAPQDPVARRTWPGSLATSDKAMRDALDLANAVLSTDPAVLPLLVLVAEPPWVDATGWLSAWPTVPGAVDAAITRGSAARDGVRSCTVYDDPCRMLHTVETAGPDDHALVERIAAFRNDEAAGVTLQLCLVTRNLLAFEDLPALAAAVLERSRPLAGGAE